MDDYMQTIHKRRAAGGKVSPNKEHVPKLLRGDAETRDEIPGMYLINCGHASCASLSRVIYTYGNVVRVYTTSYGKAREAGFFFICIFFF